MLSLFNQTILSQLILSINRQAQHNPPVPFCSSFSHLQQPHPTPKSFCLSLRHSHSLSMLTKGSQGAAAQTAGPVFLLINGINHLALQGLFIWKMNYLKVQHNALSFLLLPHYCSGRLKTHHWHSSSAPLSYHPSIFSSCHSRFPLSLSYKPKATTASIAKSIVEQEKWLWSQS